MTTWIDLMEMLAELEEEGEEEMVGCCWKEKRKTAVSSEGDEGEEMVIRMNIMMIVTESGDEDNTMSGEEAIVGRGIIIIIIIASEVRTVEIITEAEDRHHAHAHVLAAEKMAGRKGEGHVARLLDQSGKGTTTTTIVVIRRIEGIEISMTNGDKHYSLSVGEDSLDLNICN